MTPSLRTHKSNALIVITTARNLGTVPVSPSVSQHFSIAFVCLQGHSRKQCLRWLIFHSGSKSRNSSLIAVVLSSVVRERSRVATYRACYRHCRASVRDLGHEIFCAYVVAESYSKQPRVQGRSWLRRCYQSHWLGGKRLYRFYGAFCGIHNKPDISFDPSDFDVGFIGSKCLAGFVVKVVNERFYTDGCGFAVVGDALMGDGNVVDVF